MKRLMTLIIVTIMVLITTPACQSDLTEEEEIIKLLHERNCGSYDDLYELTAEMYYSGEHDISFNEVQNLMFFSVEMVNKCNTGGLRKIPFQWVDPEYKGIGSEEIKQEVLQRITLDKWQWSFYGIEQP